MSERLLLEIRDAGTALMIVEERDSFDGRDTDTRVT